MVRVANHPWQRWNSILFVRIVWWWFHRIACVIFWLQIPVSSFHCHLARRCGICQTTCKFPDRGNMNRKTETKKLSTLSNWLSNECISLQNETENTQKNVQFSVSLFLRTTSNSFIRGIVCVFFSTILASYLSCRQSGTHRQKSVIFV